MSLNHSQSILVPKKLSNLYYRAPNLHINQVIREHATSLQAWHLVPSLVKFRVEFANNDTHFC